MDNFTSWIIEKYCKRFYDILRIDPGEIDKKQDLLLTFNNDGQVQITSHIYARSIFFVGSELLAEYEKENGNTFYTRENTTSSGEV